MRPGLRSDLSGLRDRDQPLILSIGGEVHDGIEYCVWVMGRCLLVDQNGDFEEL